MSARRRLRAGTDELPPTSLFRRGATFGLGRWSGNRTMRRARPSNSRGLTLEPLETRQLLAANPLITEFMASNQATLDDGDGNSTDWIEIHNAGDAAIDLAGYRLTDDAEELNKWTFPSVNLAPGGYLVVYASGQDTADHVDAAGHLHTNFKLSAAGEAVALVAPDGSVVSQYGSVDEDYPAQLSDVSYGMAQTVVVLDGNSDASYWVPLDNIDAAWTQPDYDAVTAGFATGKAALGYEDRPNDRTNFASEIQTELTSGTHGVLTRIEFDLQDASAISTMTLRMKYDNGFIAYVNGQQVAVANASENANWYSTAIASKPRDSAALQFEDFEITQHASALVDGTNVLAIHLMNYVSSDGSDMLLVPELALGTVDMQAAFGVPTRTGFMTTPTPGLPNVSADQILDGFIGDVVISVDSGFYEDSFQVEISNDTPDSTVYYTTDSSRPSETNGTAYTGPIEISGTTVLRAAAVRPDYIPGQIASNTFIFLDDVLQQDGAGLPRTWGELGSGCNNSRPRDPAPANYDMDRQVVNDRRYRDTIRDDLKSLPVMSLVLDPEDLWSEETGIYSNPLSEGIAWERPVSVELIGTDGETEFDINAGLRIHGGWGRCPSQSNKHSMRLLFRNQYGAAKLDYPMFGEEATDSFDTFVLRANFNHSWATGGDTNTTFINDQFAAETQLEMGHVGPHSTWVHLYLNGLYWGMYNPMERPSAPFAADYFGGDKDDYDVLVVGTATDGNTQAWTALTRAASRRDYDTVQDMLDIDAAIDYFIINQYGGNWDWPQNNWYGSRKREDGAKWYFHSWDAEGMLGRGLSENRVNQTGGALGGLIGNLRQIEEFRVRYADRIQKHFFNDGLLTPSANIERLNRLAAPIDRAVVGESARWGDGRWDQVSTARTRDDHWLPRLESLREDYFPKRGDRVLDQFRAVNLFPDTEAPQLSRHGGPVQAGFELTIDNPNQAGVLLYTLDGSDPRLAGGDTSPTALVYEGATISVPAGGLHVMARVLNGREWSPLTETDFVVTSLRISEVNYHPHQPNLVPGMGEADMDSNQFEFVELANVGTESIDLTGVHFNSGIVFVFPDNTTLAPGARTVVVNDQAAFTSRYGNSRNIAGEFAGDFSDFGEVVELRDASGRTLSRFTYQVSGEWPGQANGQGSSLELIDASGSYLTTNWRASSDFGGSPGLEGTEPHSGIVINEIMGHGESPQLDMLELHNTTGDPVDLQGWYLGNPDEAPFRLQISTPTVVPSLGYLTLSETDLGFEFRIGEGEGLWLVEAGENGQPVRIADAVQVPPSMAGISIGPGPDRDGDWRPLATTTFGGPNSGPRVGDVIISEIQFDPIDLDGDGGQKADNFEFIELYNVTDQTVDLSDWRLSGGDDFRALDIPAGTSVEPNQTLLLVPFRTTSGTTSLVFRFIYGMDPTVPIVGRYRDDLPNDAGMTFRLERPSDVPGVASSDGIFVYVDEVTYGVEAPWPTGANTTGNSFTRLSPDANGNLPTSWIVDAASPGTVDFTVRVAGDSNQDGAFDQLDIVSVLQHAKYLTGQPANWEEGDWNGNGLFDQLDIVTAMQSGKYLADALAAVSPEPEPAQAQHESSPFSSGTMGPLEPEAQTSESSDGVFALLGDGLWNAG